MKKKKAGAEPDFSFLDVNFDDIDLDLNNADFSFLDINLDDLDINIDLDSIDFDFLNNI